MFHKHGLRAFGVTCLIALSALALLAGSAQAEGEFKIGGKTFAELGIEKEAIEGGQKGVGTISVPKLNIEINCQKGPASGTLLKGGTGHATITEKECTVLNGTTKAEMKSCPIGEEKEGKFVTTSSFPIPLIFLAKLVGTAVHVLVEPNPNQPLAVLTFGPECALPSPVKITGTFSALAPEKESVEQEFSFNTGSKAGKEEQELLGDKVLYASNEALIVSITGFRLAGTHVTLTWLVV